ncbi:MAG: type 4b pilus protein PilO2 [Sterolibacterium sp.]|nr:type 4b pilus protein PilO2 [Sterolibacterium sp.]MBP9798605.1 type 4b pilus protein PilO2 [Sterolibacterium sp.]
MVFDSNPSADFPELDKVQQTFEFGKRTFVSGLFWQPLPGHTLQLRKAELRKMSEEQGFDLVVQRTSGIPQAGFAATADGIRSGMLSVAAMVSKSLEMANRDRSFLCAMPIPNGQWVYVAQREGVLLHDGDLLGSEEIVQARMMNDLSLIEWQTVFAPEQWGIPGSQERRFEDLLPRRGEKYSFKSWWEVRPIRNPWIDIFLDNTRLYITLIVIALVLTGYHFWSQYRINKQLEAFARQEAEESAARMAAAAEQPWKKIPRVSAFIEACETARNSVTTLWPGDWRTTEIRCTEPQLSITWRRSDNGTLDQLLNFIPTARLTAGDGNTASLQLPLNMGKSEASEAPAREQIRTIEMYTVAQRYALNFKIKPSTGDSVPGQPANSYSWKLLDWMIEDTRLMPATIASLLDSEGFRITQLDLALREGSLIWTYKGVQYVRP